MNGSFRLISLALAGICLFGVEASAQTGSHSNLSYAVSQSVFEQDAHSGGPDLVFRNRYDGCWLTATADCFVMDRVSPRSVALVHQDSIAGPELLNANDLIFDWQYGPKVHFVLHEIPFLLGLDLEAAYFGTDGYATSETVYSTGDPAIYYFPGLNFWMGGAAGSGIRYDYVSRIHSSEINTRFYMNDRLTLLAGFRWVELHEDLNGYVTYTDPLLSQFFTINVDNHLYGFQIGIDASLLNNCGPFRIDGVLKAGIYGNFADQLYSEYYVQGNYGDKQEHTAFLGELALMGVYEITPTLLLRGGYQVMWLEGVALAAHQPATMDFSTTLAPDVESSLFYHGAFAGIEFNY